MMLRQVVARLCREVECTGILAVRGRRDAQFAALAASSLDERAQHAMMVRCQALAGGGREERTLQSLFNASAAPKEKTKKQKGRSRELEKLTQEWMRDAEDSDDQVWKNE